MADNEKKGPRDISDLKARLGLKKQPGGAPAPGPAPTPPPGGAPVPVRPAAALPTALTGIPAPSAAVPPPPGYAAPQEPAPPPPDPRRDPFAAQQQAAAANLAAFYGIGQKLPGDADAVEGAMERPKPWPMIIGGVAIGLVALVVGYSFGNISVGRNEYNETTEQAAKIRDEVTKIQNQVGDVAQILFKEVNAGGNVNWAAIEKLKALNLQEPEVTTRLFKTNYFSFETSTVQQLFSYYNDVIVLARQLQVHTLRSLNDKDAITKGIANAGKSDRRLGVILDLSQKVPSATLAELVGGPVCPTAGATDCAADVMKFGFRTSPGGSPSVRPLKGKPEAIVIPMVPTEMQVQILSGDTNKLAVDAYNRRHKEIIETLARLADEKKNLLDNLKKRADQPKLFTLF